MSDDYYDKIIKNMILDDNHTLKHRAVMDTNIKVKECIYFVNDTNNKEESYFVIIHKNKKYKICSYYLYHLIGLKDNIQYQFDKGISDVNYYKNKITRLEKRCTINEKKCAINNNNIRKNNNNIHKNNIIINKLKIKLKFFKQVFSFFISRISLIIFFIIILTKIFDNKKNKKK